MVRIAPFFSAGILVGISFNNQVSVTVLVGLVALFFTILFVLNFFGEKNQFPVVSGFLGLTAVFLLGAMRGSLFEDRGNDNHLSKITDKINAYEAVVQTTPEGGKSVWKVEVEVMAARVTPPALTLSTTPWRSAMGKVVLYVSRKNHSKVDWHFGDRILVRGVPREIKPPANPGEFDFKRYYKFKNTTHQDFVQPEDVRLVSSASSKGFVYYSNLARAWSIRKIRDYVPDENESAVAIALILGVTESIDDDTKSAFAASGAMHVLAVSGMQVGIIYAVVLFLFKPFKSRSSKWVIAIISLTLLLAFALVTGLSPSVLRAVTMFTFVALALPLKKRINTYNTLAASAFLLLIYDPFLIVSVGFQLSYLAVIGIVYLYRPLYNLLEIENKLGDWAWKITCLTLAAQAATLALSLFYFHQFPTYFLLSNLLVVPLSTLVLIIGIFLLLLSFFSPVAAVVAFTLQWLIKALNWIVLTVEDFPLSLVDGIYISGPQCVLLMGILLTMILLFQTRSVKWLYTSFFFVVVFTFLQWDHFFYSIRQKQMIIYAINNHQAVEFIERGHSFFAFDSLLQNDAPKIRFHIQPNRLEGGVSMSSAQIPFCTRCSGVTYYRWKNKTIALVDSRDFKLPSNFKLDLLVGSNNSLVNVPIEKLQAKCIVFDGSNSNKIVSYLVEENKNGKVFVHSVNRDGAFIF